MARRKPNCRIRKGTATIELAVCLPLIVTLTLGAIETTSLISLRQKLLTSAYETARTASGPMQTSSAAITAGGNVLTARGVNGGVVTISPDPVTAATPTGTEIAATVTAPVATNLCMRPFVLNGIADLAVTVRMVRQ